MDIASINLTTPQGLAPTQAPPAERTQDQRELIRAVRAVNATEMFGQDNELTFILDRESRKAIVRIVNRQTREVVQQIPLNMYSESPKR